jgi:DNA recombination protein RmuC
MVEHCDFDEQVTIRGEDSSFRPDMVVHMPGELFVPVDRNVNLALIRQALGHRSITSTMQYGGTSDGQAAEATQAALMRLH